MRRSPNQSRTRGAFTIIEILVVVALILVLLSIVIVAVGSATRTAQMTNTSALMSSIKQALVQFENEVGYLPPVLTPQRDLYWESLDPPNGRSNGPDPSNIGQYENEAQEWYSITTLAEYLIGYGPEGEDGHDGPGIRNPGADGYWGATNQGLLGNSAGTFNGRVNWLDSPGPFELESASYRSGRVLGPYLQLRDDHLLGAIERDPNADPNDPNFQVYLPGEALPAGQDWNDMPKVIVDYWGQPIRYYRKPYPVGGLSRGYRQVVRDPNLPGYIEVPSLADVYLLRPWTVRGSEVDTRFGDANNDTTATTNLLSAEFAIFSAGPDQRFDPTVRVDADEFNSDNIVELGP